MNLTNILAISGIPGMYKMVGNRANGLIVEEMATGKRRFVSSRKHQFSPLESISIYTLADTVPLEDVFQKMKEKQAELPPVAPKSPPHELFQYFEEIIPDFDEDRVKAGDIKKVIQWYTALNTLNLLDASSEEE